MKTRYKIIVIAVCAYFGVFFGPVIASNAYCDFIAQEMCTSRITGVSLPPFNMIPLTLPSDNECFFENTEGVMEPCYIETGYFEWPFPPRMNEYEHDHKCDEICVDAISEKRTVSETKKLWKSTDDWNSLNLIRNNDNLYCSSVNEELIDHCYSLENIVFGDGGKKKETGWKLYPGGAGWTLPENSTLVPIYKEVEFGIPPLDFTAMLDDKIFVNKCESNGGMWNYTRHDCEGLWEVCPDIGGITIQEDITPPCIDTGIIDDDPLTVKVCHGAGIIRASCVFEYEN